MQQTYLDAELYAMGCAWLMRKAGLQQGVHWKALPLEQNRPEPCCPLPRKAQPMPLWFDTVVGAMVAVHTGGSCCQQPSAHALWGGVGWEAFPTRRSLLGVPYTPSRGVPCCFSTYFHRDVPSAPAPELYKHQKTISGTALSPHPIL